MEEAICSSQMEGAATIRKIAKEMLRKDIAPRDRSQQMIANNYRTIQFIVAHKDAPLSTDLLLQVHRLMTVDTLSHPEDAGRFRCNDNVVVENGIMHETVHTPPPCGDILSFVDDLCAFFNAEGEHSQVFLHPIVRAIVVHFMVAYVHPFADGNGRTARALFYWHMLRQGYALTEYLSISRVIAKSKQSYERSFLCTEADGLDIGYFVNYNLGVLRKSFVQLQEYISRKEEEQRAAQAFLQIGDINERQAQILGMFQKNADEVLTVKEVCARFGVSPTTAKADLISLVSQGLLREIAFNKVKRGYVRGDAFERVAKNIGRK